VLKLLHPFEPSRAFTNFIRFTRGHPVPTPSTKKTCCLEIIDLTSNKTEHDTVMFNFTPLSGARSSSEASQSLLELDGGIKILVDVGWDETFDEELLRGIER